MNNCKSAIRIITVFSLLVATAMAADGPKLTFKFHDLKFPGATGTSAYAINNSGIVVGQYFIQGVAIHGFMFDHGTWTTIDDPNGTDTLCLGINSQGDIVGAYTTPSGNNQGFLYHNHEFTDITLGLHSSASGINDHGDIVGVFEDASGAHGYLRVGKKIKQLDLPDVFYTSAGQINNNRTITVVTLDLNGHYHSYLYRHGKYKEVTVPGASETLIHGINNLDDLILNWQGSDQTFLHGALRLKGRFHKFDYRKNTQTFAFGLNDRRAVVGSWYNGFAGGAFKATY